MEVEQQYGDQVTFIGLPSLSDVSSMEEFIVNTGTDGLLHLPDIEGRVWDQFGVSQQRTYVFIDDDGTWRRSGYGSLQSDVEGLIAQ